ncbi:SPOR domain-containing protein [Sulfitobacter sp. HNIBRBA2951]|uniref:SPOR domain-containing protein n=1 Tax=Sulfitobacter aquimarinus TaxID=3158557 RepID=UPI0032DFC967
MADFTHAPQGGFAPHVHPEYSVAPAGAVTKLTNVAGAVVSLALVVGVGVWGYKLLVRDVSGIPVVRAASGEMRVRPENPGGQLAQHTGLSVNTVAVTGADASRTQELRLAPQPIDLAEDDAPMLIPQEAAVPATPDPVTLPAPEVVQEAAVQNIDAREVAAALESGSVDSLVAQLTDGIAPMEDLDGETVPVPASVSTTQAAQLLDGEGLRVSLRPSLRPKRAARAVPVAASASVSTSSGLDVAAASVPAGTRVVQLGAFDSPEIARSQWTKLSAQFAPFIEGKQRIVMEAKSGGRTFYRLRAMGFDDIGDARRFCSALVAENVDCIPVVTR